VWAGGTEEGKQEYHAPNAKSEEGQLCCVYDKDGGMLPQGWLCQFEAELLRDYQERGG